MCFSSSCLGNNTSGSSAVIHAGVHWPEGTDLSQTERRHAGGPTLLAELKELTELKSPNQNKQKAVVVHRLPQADQADAFRFMQKSHTLQITSSKVEVFMNLKINPILDVLSDK